MTVNKIAVLIATAGGVGYFPAVPATFGSAVGVGIWLLFPGSPALCALLIALGFWSSRLAVLHFKQHDPRPVVIDEVSAQYLALLIQGPTGTLGIMASFVLFRILDVLKPLGIRKLERYPNGVGVMLDDLAAALVGGLFLYMASHGPDFRG